MTETEKEQAHGVMQLNKDEWMKAYLIENCGSYSSLEDLQNLYEWWTGAKPKAESKPKLRPVT